MTEIILGPVQAIKTCLQRSFNFSGLAGRREYWYFLPVGLALPLAAGLLLARLLPELSVVQVFALSSVALCPLVAVTARRLRDAGGHPENLRLPLTTFLHFVLALSLFDAAAAWLDKTIELAGSPGGFFLALLAAPFLLTALIIIACILFFGLFTGSALFGQMLLPTASPGSSAPSRHLQFRTKIRK